MRIFTAIVFGILLWTATMAPAEPMTVDSYAAMVNDRLITAAEVITLVRPVEQQLRDTYKGKELNDKVRDLYKKGTDSLIERALILEEFEKQGGNIPDQAVDDHINEIIREKFGNNRAEFLKALAEERMTIDEWREETKERMIVTYFRRKEVNDKVFVSPNAVKDAYNAAIEKYRIPETIQLRMIVLHKGTNEVDQAAKLREAQRIRERLMAGEDFATLAKNVSEGSKAAQGGDMGWIEPSSLRTELSTVAAQLSPGQLSDVVDTGDELYLLRLEGRKEASVTPFEQVAKGIEDELKKQENERLYTAWIARLRKKYYVKIF